MKIKKLRKIIPWEIEVSSSIKTNFAKYNKIY